MSGRRITRPLPTDLEPPELVPGRHLLALRKLQMSATRGQEGASVDTTSGRRITKPLSPMPAPRRPSSRVLNWRQESLESLSSLNRALPAGEPSASRRPDSAALTARPTPCQQPRKTFESLLVVAIDFGTTYSGFAFSFKSDFDKDPLRVQCLNIESGEGLQKSQATKVPTAILFTPEKIFSAFGYEAEDKYARMKREEATKWYMFDRFKMNLHNTKGLSRDDQMLDKTKKKAMLTSVVFTAAIKHLKDLSLKTLTETKGLVDEKEITWVLTVPAIWDDSAKQFMREAATEAGIDNNQLELALEPEAASIYCSTFFKANQKACGSTDFSKEGARFMTVDCGGGTVDISVFQVGEGQRLKQLHKPEGDACGGTLVDDAFKGLLMDILGFDGLTAVDGLENLALMREFERAKKAIGSASKIAIGVPQTMKCQMEITLKNGAHGVTMMAGKMMVEGGTAEVFFQKSVGGIVAAMRKVLTSEKVGRVDAILLVGGFSEAKVIQEAIKKAFPRDRVLVPPSPALTVVMGAVLYGHSPKVIATRIAPFTYGMEVEENFVEDYHDAAKRKEIDGQDCCSSVFDVFINVNDSVASEQTLPPHTISPAQAGQKVMHLKIFRSTERNPRYVTDGSCQQIGSVTVRMPDLAGEKKREVLATMSVSGTELKVTAKDKTTGKEFSTTCDLLSRQ